MNRKKNKPLTYLRDYYHPSTNAVVVPVVIPKYNVSGFERLLYMAQVDYVKVAYPQPSDWACFKLTLATSKQVDNILKTMNGSDLQAMGYCDFAFDDDCRRWLDQGGIDARYYKTHTSI